MNNLNRGTEEPSPGAINKEPLVTIAVSKKNQYHDKEIHLPCSDKDIGIL
ncbi:MAG: hypothetical protein PHQ94_05300 [Syntrophomonas sp.]|nr:hypothetical protein [Syntrophomonas sp.]